MSCPKPIFQVESCMGSLAIWPLRDCTSCVPAGDPTNLVEVSLSYGWDRLTPEELPKLASHLEEFVVALREYHAHLQAGAPLKPNQKRHEALGKLWGQLDDIAFSMQEGPTHSDPRPDLTAHELEAYRAITRAASAIIDARNALNQQLATEASATPTNPDPIKEEISH